MERGREVGGGGPQQQAAAHGALYLGGEQVGILSLVNVRSVWTVPVCLHSCLFYLLLFF